MNGTTTTLDRHDRPIRDLRISVTDRCNFRCPYCMPAEVFGKEYSFLPRAELLTFEEIERLARIFVSLGVRKLRLTGGEPLLRAELTDLVGRLASIEGVEDLALTTNGMLLARHAQALRAAGLQRLTISLDSLDPEVFKLMSGQGAELERVLEGLHAAEEAGFDRMKVNCVVRRGVNDHTLVDLARRFKGTGHIVRFIEFMDVGTVNGWELRHVLTAAEIVALIDAEMPIERMQPNYPGEVATRWRYRDGTGEIGVIASVSQPFCGGCTRARLSTEGRLVTCLFATGGHDLRSPLRGGAGDDEIQARIAAVWTGRADRYSEGRAAATDLSGRSRIEMFQIGG
jgi:cyclic pyranopterin phosphate synthase